MTFKQWEQTLQEHFVGSCPGVSITKYNSKFKTHAKNLKTQQNQIVSFKQWLICFIFYYYYYYVLTNLIELVLRLLAKQIYPKSKMRRERGKLLRIWSRCCCSADMSRKWQCTKSHYRAQNKKTPNFSQERWFSDQMKRNPEKRTFFIFWFSPLN